MKFLEDLIYCAGRVATLYYPPGRYRWEEVWDHYRRYGTFR